MTMRPCPEDQSKPLAPRSTLADVALAAGVDPKDVRAFLSSRYHFSTSDIGLVEVSP